MMLSGAVGLVVFMTYPVAPPRLADPELVDTVTEFSTAYRVLQPPAFTNPYAAMPSLHVGWDLLIGIAVVVNARWLWLKVVGTLLPAVMARGRGRHGQPLRPGRRGRGGTGPGLPAGGDPGDAPGRQGRPGGRGADAARTRRRLADVVAGAAGGAQWPGRDTAPVTERRLLTVAHRRGNTVTGLREALDCGVDLVEADVHAYRGRLEVRHLKTMGLLPWLWDRGELVHRRRHTHLELAELVASLGDDHRLMIDLKGVHPRLAPRVAGLLREASPGLELTVCTKSWWMLDAFDVPVRRVLSAASRRGVARLRARVAAGPVHGASVRLSLLTPELVTELHRGTDLVMTWPVDTPEALAQARRVGVDAVISKDLDLLRGVIAGR